MEKLSELLVPHQPPCPGQRRPQVTEADIPHKPPLLPKDASDDAIAERTRIMAQRRKMMEQLREQTRVTRQQAQRARPLKEVESDRRAFQRALAASEIAMRACDTTAVPSFDTEAGLWRKPIVELADLPSCAAEQTLFWGTSLNKLIAQAEVAHSGRHWKGPTAR